MQSGNGPRPTRDGSSAHDARYADELCFRAVAIASVLGACGALYVYGYLPVLRELRDAERAQASDARQHEAALAELASELEHTRHQLERARTELEQKAAEPAVATVADEAAEQPPARAERRRGGDSSRKKASSARPARKTGSTSARHDAATRTRQGALSGVLSDSDDPLVGL